LEEEEGGSHSGEEEGSSSCQCNSHEEEEVFDHAPQKDTCSAEARPHANSRQEKI